MDELAEEVKQDLQLIASTCQGNALQRLQCMVQLVLSYADDVQDLHFGTLTELLQSLLGAVLSCVTARRGQPGHIQLLQDTWPSFLSSLQVFKAGTNVAAAAAVRQQLITFWTSVTRHLLVQDSLPLPDYLSLLGSLGSFLPALLDCLLCVSSACSVQFLQYATELSITRLLAYVDIKLPGTRSRAVDLLWDMVADVEETDSSRLDWLAPHFANVVAMLQVPAFTNNPAADHTQAENALAAVSSVAEQAYQFLRRRKLLLYPDNIWDGCMASVINSLATLAANKGLKALSRPGMQHVRSMVAQPEAAQFVLRILLTLPVVSEAKKGVKLVLDVFMLLYRGQGQCILSGCGECLKPESNYPCSLRLAVLNAMDSVANSYLDECGENDAAILALWPAEALDMVIFTLAHDHSLRNRRAAMSLLTTVVVEKKTAKETALLRAILQRCRDQDLLIREHASAMLAQFGSSSLRAVLQHSDWCTLLDIGLAEGQQAGSAHPHLDSPKHAPVEQAGETGTADQPPPSKKQCMEADKQASIHASALQLFTKLLATGPSKAQTPADEPQQPGNIQLAATSAATAGNAGWGVLRLAEADDSLLRMYGDALEEAIAAKPTLRTYLLSQVTHSL